MRNAAVVVAQADVAAPNLIALGDGANVVKELMLAHRGRHVQGAGQLDVGRHGGVRQVVQRLGNATKDYNHWNKKLVSNTRKY